MPNILTHIFIHPNDWNRQNWESRISKENNKSWKENKTYFLLGIFMIPFAVCLFRRDLANSKVSKMPKFLSVEFHIQQLREGEYFKSSFFVKMKRGIGIFTGEQFDSSIKRYTKYRHWDKIFGSFSFKSKMLNEIKLKKDERWNAL